MIREKDFFEPRRHEGHEGHEGHKQRKEEAVFTIHLE
jgi:hypothetical protein